MLLFSYYSVYSLNRLVGTITKIVQRYNKKSTSASKITESFTFSELLPTNVQLLALNLLETRIATQNLRAH